MNWKLGFYRAGVYKDDCEYRGSGFSVKLWYSIGYLFRLQHLDTTPNASPAEKISTQFDLYSLRCVVVARGRWLFITPHTLQISCMKPYDASFHITAQHVTLTYWCLVGNLGI